MNSSRENSEPRPVWYQRDGTPIHIEAMSTEHIKNSLALLRRTGFMSHADYLAEVAAEGCPPWDSIAYEIDEFENELARRGESPE